jgi:O-methyltransferase
MTPSALFMLLTMMMAWSPKSYTAFATMDHRLVQQYLHLVEMAVTGSLTDEAGRCNGVACKLDQVLPYNATMRKGGDDWPPLGHTMVGHDRLHNIRDLIKAVVRNNVPGDFAELGVWRGGSCIYAKAVLDVMREDTRQVLVFGK